MPPLTQLNIGPVAPDSAGRDVAAKKNCPQCDAPASKRIDASGFGRTKLTVCGYCGFEFTEGA